MKKWIVLILILTCVLCLEACGKSESEPSQTRQQQGEKSPEEVSFDAEVLEVSDTYLLVRPADDSNEIKSADQITISLKNKAKSWVVPAVGDTIRIFYDGIIMESYPAQIGNVFRIEQVSGTGGIQLGCVYPQTTFDVAVSYANWAELNELYAGALNSDKMYISSVRHLPIYKFDTQAELRQFQTDFGDVLTMDQGYDEVPSFYDVTAKYDEAFFEEKTLMLVYVEASSGSLRFDVSSVFCDGDLFCIRIDQINNPEVCTDDMAGWFITVAVPDSMVESCFEFDAAFTGTKTDSELLLSGEEGAWVLTLPESGQKITLSDKEERFVPYITDALVESAEKKIAEETAQYGKRTNFYLQIDGDYLWLGAEVIRNIDPPAEQADGEFVISGGCGIDHEHIFCKERISTQAVKEIEELTDGTVFYSSGGNRTTALRGLVWASQDNGDGTFSEADGLGIRGELQKENVQIPELHTYPGGIIETVKPANVQITDVYLMQMPDPDYPMEETTWEEIKTLDPGRYYVVSRVVINNRACYEELFCLVVQNPDIGCSAGVKMLQYTWDGWGISTKTVAAGDVAYDIMDELKNLKETGETTPKISDDVLELGSGEYPVERGTMWLESEGKIYRLASDFSQICLVESYFGEGKVLEITEKLKTDVNNAWQYAPYDYYKGTYNRGDDTVELVNVYKADSSVRIKIKEVHIDSGYDPQNTIAVELVSTADQAVSVKMHCRQSSDNLAMGDGKKIKLEKGVPFVVELTFGGWSDFGYWVYIQADNTIAEIKINP